MKPKTLAAIIASAMIAVNSASCMPSPSYSPDIIPVARVIDDSVSTASPENNPFVLELDYDPESAFLFLDEPKEGLKGTIVSSGIEYMNVREGMTDGGPHIRPYTNLTVRDQMGDELYFIYPAAKDFPSGTKVEVRKYWPLKEGVLLMNNMLVHLTSLEDSTYTSFYEEFDFPIQSAAEDGHFDGVIMINGIDYILDEAGK